LSDRDPSAICANCAHRGPREALVSKVRRVECRRWPPEAAGVENDVLVTKFRFPQADEWCGEFKHRETAPLETKKPELETKPAPPESKPLQIDPKPAALETKGDPGYRVPQERHRPQGPKGRR
jgi:hypothetical protein